MVLVFKLLFTFFIFIIFILQTGFIYISYKTLKNKKIDLKEYNNTKFKNYKKIIEKFAYIKYFYIGLIILDISILIILWS